MVKVTVIIPNWNGKEYLKTCLPSLIKQSFKDFEIILIDNGSTDGSVKFAERFVNLKIIKLKKNIGFAPAVNLGIESSKSEYLVLLNNDTKVDIRCLEYLVKAAESHPEVGMVAAKMLNFYNPKLIDSAGDYIDAVGHANNIGWQERDGEKFNQAKNIFLVSGGGCLIKRQVILKVGLLDDDFFAYFEDVDFCFRAQLAGFKAWFEPRAKIFHVHKATSRRNQGLTEYLQFRNMTITVIKNFPPKLLIHNFNWLKILLVNINTVRFLATQGYFKEALKAEIYILTHLLNILLKRRKTQSLKVVSDEYIISWVLPKKITLFGLFRNGI
ncbi:MAG: glycosyltransferase family 2 protein [Candidatus Daviesbacteria bacterium]|nr:glycosyltransferase family 2 protein [Candidatus Daviesbacteria bacterium]